MMMQQQDQTMDTIAGTLSTLAEQAGLMGREINEHNEYVVIPLAHSFTLIDYHFRMLDDLEQNVDRSDAKLSGAMSKMKKFIRQTEGAYYILASP